MKRAERRVTLCLDGELYAKYEDAEARLSEARLKQATDRRLNSPVLAIEKEVFELFEAQRKETITFVLRALPRAKWDALVEAHPARDGVEVDDQYGFNVDTIFDPAMAHEDPTTIVRVADNEGVVLDFKPADWQELSDNMSKSQYERFRVAISALNGGTSEIPFSHTAFKASQDSGGKSK